MSNTNTGGPAFSRTGENCQSINEEGMSLRDYFAAKAMQTLLGSEYTSDHGLHEGCGWGRLHMNPTWWPTP